MPRAHIIFLGSACLVGCLVCSLAQLCGTPAATTRCLYPLRWHAITTPSCAYFLHSRTALTDHFRVDHFMCPHPRCLDKKFVVFETEQEMKRHFATEHGDELKMSRAQRREASSVAIPLQYREGGRDPEAEAAAHTAAMLAAPGVTIGGGHNVGSRHGPRGGAMHHSRSEPQMQSALQVRLLGQGHCAGGGWRAELGRAGLGVVGSGGQAQGGAGQGGCWGNEFNAAWYHWVSRVPALKA